MGRPSQFDREAAIETVMHDLWRDGFEANSVSAISAKLGITRSSFYNAFGTREALFKEALALYFSRAPDRVFSGPLPDSSIIAWISETFRQICAARASDPEARGCLAVNSLTELSGVHDELGAMTRQAVLHSSARLEELLILAQERGELPTDTPVHAKALALQNLLIGVNVFAKTLTDEDELWLTVKTTLEGLGLYKGAPDAEF
ncbi:MAG: TetR/AcrR family transcriptional regulator [Thalassovita sp.]